MFPVRTEYDRIPSSNGRRSPDGLPGDDPVPGEEQHEARVAYTYDMSDLSMRPRYSEEEFARRGDEIYDRDILPKLKPDDKGIIAIDIETGEYAIAPDELTASNRLLTRRPEAQVWIRRIGSRYLYRFGHHGKSVAFRSTRCFDPSERAEP